MINRILGFENTGVLWLPLVAYYIQDIRQNIDRPDIAPYILEKTNGMRDKARYIRLLNNESYQSRYPSARLKD